MEIKGNVFSQLDFSKDMHTHPYEKGQSFEAMEAFVLRAIELKYTEIVFSDHAPIDERLKAPHGLSMDEFVRYYKFSRELQNKYTNTIRIIIGIEADYHPLNITIIENLKKEYPVDFVLGSIHLHSQYWESDIVNLNADELIEFSFKVSLELVNSGFYDGLAHFDRFRQVFFKRNYDFDPFTMKEQFIGLFEAVKKNNMLLEINANICNSPAGGSLENYVEMIKWSKELGIKYVIGSDAHRAADIGKWFYELKHLL